MKIFAILLCLCAITFAQWTYLKGPQDDRQRASYDPADQYPGGTLEGAVVAVGTDIYLFGGYGLVHPDTTQGKLEFFISFIL